MVSSEHFSHGVKPPLPIGIETHSCLGKSLEKDYNFYFSFCFPTPLSSKEKTALVSCARIEKIACPFPFSRIREIIPRMEFPGKDYVSQP